MAELSNAVNYCHVNRNALQVMFLRMYAAPNEVSNYLEMSMGIT